MLAALHQCAFSMIWVASLSEFDQKCYEDENTMRFADTTKLFETIINTPIFAQRKIFIIFNKKDIFIEKLKTTLKRDWHF